MIAPKKQVHFLLVQMMFWFLILLVKTFPGRGVWKWEIGSKVLIKTVWYLYPSSVTLIQREIDVSLGPKMGDRPGTDGWWHYFFSVLSMTITTKKKMDTFLCKNLFWERSVRLSQVDVIREGFCCCLLETPSPPSHIQTFFLTIAEKALTRKKEAGKGGKEDGMEGGRNGREVCDSKHAACYLWPGLQNSGGIGRWLGFLSSSAPWMTSSGRSWQSLNRFSQCTAEPRDHQCWKG